MNLNERLQKISYKGKEIIKVDYRNCNEAQLIALTHLHKELVLKENKESLFLANYENTFGTPDYMSAAKDFTASTRHLITKGAFLGITGPKVFLLKGITYFINVNFKTFSEEKDALDWLVD
ncbi:MAG: hypothetical protein DI538_25390 [Azospira oryzae]|jgi:hypothetical protein|nr:MAG: hypothetical protein DI538_25390 [Azospira oryzae]